MTTNSGNYWGAVPLNLVYASAMSSVIQPIVERRSLPSFPSSLPTPYIWQDAAQESGSDNIILSSIQDRAVSRSYTAVGTTRLRTNRLNGRNTYQHSNDVVIAGFNPPSALSLATGFCTWTVANLSGGAASNLSSGSPNHQFTLNYNSGGTILFYDGTFVNSETLPAGDLTGWHIYMCVRNAANEILFFVDGNFRVAIPTARTTTMSVAQTMLKRTNGTTGALEFGENGAIDSAMSLSQIDDLGNYLASKWGLTWNTVQFHADTETYRTAITTNAGTINLSTLQLVDRHLTRPLQDYKASLSGFYPIAGNNLNAARTQLFGASSMTLTNFVSGDYSQSTGLKGNASNKSANTNVNANALSVSSGSLGIYGTEFDASGSNTIFAGRLSADGSGLRLSRENTFLVARLGESALNANVVSTTQAGMIALNATSANNLQLWINNSSVATQSSSRTYSTTGNIAAFASFNSAGTAISFSAVRMRSMFIGAGLSNSAMTAIYTAILNFNTALGRAA